MPADTVKLIYEHGERVQEAGRYFDGTPDPQLGKFERFEALPNDPDALQSLLQEERRSREQLPPGDFKGVSGKRHQRRAQTASCHRPGPLHQVRHLPRKMQIRGDLHQVTEEETSMETIKLTMIGVIPCSNAFNTFLFTSSFVSPK